MRKLIKQLGARYPQLRFVPGTSFYWSPQTQEVFYKDDAKLTEVALWSLLHEAGHALLEHQNYQSDLELVIMESEAWQKATELAAECAVTPIDPDHIQDCLDTYRDWLHRRSACPVCGTKSLQASSVLYSCFNCRSTWQVSAARFCRPYRKTAALDQPVLSSY